MFSSYTYCCVRWFPNICWTFDWKPDDTRCTWDQVCPAWSHTFRVWFILWWPFQAQLCCACPSQPLGPIGFSFGDAGSSDYTRTSFLLYWCNRSSSTCTASVHKSSGGLGVLHRYCGGFSPFYFLVRTISCVLILERIFSYLGSSVIFFFYIFAKFVLFDEIKELFATQDLSGWLIIVLFD